MNFGLTTHHSKFLDYAEIVGEEYKRLRLEEGQRELKERLGILLQKIDNRTCADCGREGPRWANTNLGLFFCIDCSSAHRNLGGKKVEKSKNLIKSVHRDVWTASQVEVRSVSINFPFPSSFCTFSFSRWKGWEIRKGMSISRLDYLHYHPRNEANQRKVIPLY
jgi:hypothetical protein